MAVTPTTPPLSTLPAPPLPTDAEADFDAKAGASLTAQVQMVAQINVALTWQAASMAATLDYATAAAQSAQYAAAAADRAEAVDTNVSEQVLAAQTAANNAAASAAAAEASPGSIGNLALIHSLTIGMMRRY